MGIGEAIAACFVDEGANVVITSRDLSRAEIARERIAAHAPPEAGGSVGHPQPGHERVLAFACDVRRREDLENLARAAMEKYGRIDIWVNNAGHGLLDSVEKMDAADYRALFDTNLFGAVEGMKVAIAPMRKQGAGTIINISSVAGHIAVPYMAAYSASKAALNAIGRAAAIELRGTGIRVMTVCPGYIATDFPTNATRGSDVQRLSPARKENRRVSADVVARATLNGYLKRKKHVVVPWNYRIYIGLYRLWPGLIEWSMARMLRQA